MSTSALTADFPARYAAARQALATAERHTAPMPAEMAETLRAWNPAKFAEMERKLAEIAATIPALQAAHDELHALACHRCDGTGEYAGASRYLRQGVKFCFTCSGRGHL